MRIANIANHRILVANASEIIAKNYATEPVDLNALKQFGTRLISKTATKNKILSAPFSMLKLAELMDMDEYHCGCIEAIVNSALIKVECKNAQVTKWLLDAEYPSCESDATVLSEFLRFYLATGNGFMVKMRSVTGQWVGLERMLPSEMQIVENYDDYGFLKPNYIQTRNSQKKDFLYPDIIHLKKSTHLSNAWGLACLPVAINIEILKEIKTFDYNNFKNGLLLDYFMIVEGGSLRDGTVIDEDGNEVISDAFADIQTQLAAAKGTANAHSSILIESENKDVKIRLEPLRQSPPDGGFITLKKDLREGIFAYHRVPPRIVSQLVSGQLGGDNNSDMTLFYNFVIKPIQRRLAETLANEFIYEFPGCNVTPNDFDFGNLTELLKSDDQKLFSTLRND